MADECIMSMPEYDGLDYTMKEYMRYVEYVKTCVERLNSQSPGEFFLDLIFKLKFFLVLKAISKDQILLRSRIVLVFLHDSKISQEIFHV